MHLLFPILESARFSSRDFFPPMKMNFQKKVKWQVHAQNTDDITESRRSMEVVEGNEILLWTL